MMFTYVQFHHNSSFHLWEIELNIVDDDVDEDADAHTDDAVRKWLLWSS